MAKKNKKIINSIEKEDFLGLKINNKKTLIFIIIIIILLLVLSFVLNVYLLFFRENKVVDNCPKCEEQKEVIVKEKYINYNGYNFMIPEEWNFVSSDNSYKLSNKNNNLEIELLSDETNYEDFKNEEVLKPYLQDLQVEMNISKVNSKEITENEKTYYFIEGKKDSYLYNRVILPCDSGMIMIDVLYENQKSYNNLKNDVINFATSYVKNNV